MGIYEQFLMEKVELQKKIQKEQEIIAKFPPGILKIRRSGKYDRWFQIKVSKKSNRSRGLYIPKANRRLAGELAEKLYHIWNLEYLQNELKAIDAYLAVYDPDQEMAAEKLNHNPKIRELLVPLPAEDDDNGENNTFHENSSDTGAAIHPKGLKYVTLNGTLVRSKSEVIIANILSERRIPFSYELPLRIGNIDYVPDFTVRNVRTGQTFVWEHFGMMDKPGYLQNTLTKMNIFLNNGYIPNINLITTFETEEHGLDSRYVDSLVNQFLV